MSSISLLPRSLISLAAVFAIPALLLACPPAANAIDRSMLHNMAFEETVNRYPSPLAVLETMKSVAPFREKSEEPCLEIGVASAPVLGANEPAQMQPLETQPGALFFNYFEKCTTKIAALGFADESNAEKNSEMIFGRDFANEVLRAAGIRSVKEMWNSKQFSSFAPEMQNRIIDQAINYLIGPEEVVRHFRYIGEKNVFARDLPTIAALRSLIIEKLGAPNVTLLSFYSRTSVLLLVGPALKD